MMTHQGVFSALIAVCLVASKPVIGIEVRNNWLESYYYNFFENNFVTLVVTRKN